jgi:hypothetical protein
MTVYTVRALCLMKLPMLTHFETAQTITRDNSGRDASGQIVEYLF